MAGTAVNVLRTVGEGVAQRLGKLWEPTVERGFYQSGESGLRHIGPLAETLGQMARTARDSYETRFSKVLQYREPLAHDLIKEGKGEEVINDLERKVRATDPRAVALSDYDRLLNTALYSEAAKSGIKVGPLVPDDFHHMWDPELFKGVNQAKLVQKLIAGGEATDESDALRIIRQNMQTSGGRVHTLQSPRRINLPGYRRDLAVMSDHFGATIKKIENAKVFGAKDEVYTQMLSQILKDHGQFAHDYTRNVINHMLGRGPGYTTELDEGMGRGFYRKIASLEAVMHLGLAFLSHSGQFLNTTIMASRSGLTPTVRALVDAVQDHGNAISFANRSSATFLHSIRDFRRIAGAETETIGSKVLRYTPFSYIDKLRRVFAANVGKHYAEQQFERWSANQGDKIAERNLRLLDLDPTEIKRAGGLQEEHLLKAAKRMSDITQLRTDALTTPPRWLDQKDPLLRLAVMYKQFFFHQAKFIKDQVLKPAFIEHEFRPLIYMSLLFPTFGEMVADLKEVARKGNLEGRPKMDRDHWLDRAINNYSQIGGFGIMADLVNAFAQPDRSAAFRFAVGPVVGDAIDIARLPFVPHPVDAIERKILQSIPTVGPYAAHKVFPPKREVKTPEQRGVYTKELNKLLGIK